MITVQLEPLPQKADDDLRRWLGQESYKNLRRVIDAQVKKYQAEALKEAVQSGPGNMKLESANANLQKSQRYQAALDVLDEVVTMTGPHQTAKVS